MKYKFTLSIGYPGANHEEIFEIEESEIDGITEDEKEAHIERLAIEWANNFIDIAYELEDGE